MKYIVVILVLFIIGCTAPIDNTPETIEQESILLTQKVTNVQIQYENGRLYQETFPVLEDSLVKATVINTGDSDIRFSVPTENIDVVIAPSAQYDFSCDAQDKEFQVNEQVGQFIIQ